MDRKNKIMRKIHFIWVFLFCISCSGHDYVEEDEKEEVRDSVYYVESNDSTQNTPCDSITSNEKDTTYTSNPPEEDDTVRFRTFSVLGNSISTYSGYIPSGYANYYTKSKMLAEETWWMLLSSKEEFELASNASWSGSTVINAGTMGPNSYFSAEGRLKALSIKGIPELILILGGTNDWGYNLGCLGDYPIGDNYDLKTFRGAYSYLVVRLKNLYPNTSIICCSLLPRKESRTQKNNYGVTQLEIDESIAYIAKVNNVYFVDMSVCGLEKNIGGLTFDGLHPNKAGMKVIADFLYEKLKSLGF